MSYYTTIAKNVRCPFLDDRVIITGKYQINAYTDNASFLYATCSIVENSKLPPYEQDESIKYFSCPNGGNCNLLDKFEDSIDLTKYGL